MTEPLTRAHLEARRGSAPPLPPVRIVHLGLGAFHRAHQAWYTSAVDDSARWGIAAFTGRNARMFHDLAPQDGLYSLVTRGRDADTISIVSSIVEVHDGADIAGLTRLISAPATAIVTLTITEAGYRLGSDGLPDAADAAVADDIAVLARLGAGGAHDSDADALRSALGRLTYALHRRWREGAGPLAIVPCDNLPDNGRLVRTGMVHLARRVSPDFARWMDREISFVSTSVDRITPKTTPEDVATVARESGWDDRAPVVTEPFSDWVLSGSFPGGRPLWERAGARFVDDIEPFERRKLWLLNGAHSLLAYTGPQRGHETVASAIRDDALRRAVEDYWDEAVRHLPAAELDLDRYRADLLERFGNPRIEHRLGQIGMDAVTKLRVRIAPIIRAERAAGRSGGAGLRVLAGWVELVRSRAAPADGAADAIADALARSTAEASAAPLVALIDPELSTVQDLEEWRSFIWQPLAISSQT